MFWVFGPGGKNSQIYNQWLKMLTMAMLIIVIMKNATLTMLLLTFFKR